MKAMKSGCLCSLHFLAQNLHWDFERLQICQDLEPLQCNSNKELSNNANERNTTVIIAAIPIIFIKYDNICVFQVLWNFAFLPAVVK